ncbi:MAG TPA: DNA repair protein RecN [Terriglobales bacterium]|nr:DNA repair protein RecN [Terriglobales bacterium]
MLRELRLENYAVIDNVVVEFASGLNLLTGETGAGKSILIDALALLLGGKASTDVIRHGAERAVVAAVFEAEGKTARTLVQLLEGNGLDEEAGEIIVRREIAAAGKGRVFINNQPATVAVLRQLAPHLAAIHAQSESLVSFDAAARLELLDAFAGAQMEPVEAAFHKWKAVRERIAELERDEQDRLRLLDLWTFQQKEIGAAHPQAGEDEQIESEKRVLANAEKIYAAAMGAYDLLYESNASASSALRAAQRQIEELARFEPKFKELAGTLDSARITVEDAGATLRDYAGGVQASPERLAEIEDRLAILDRLKRKYGPTLADAIAFGEEVSRKISEMQNKDEVLGQLRKELSAAAQEYVAVAKALSRKRQEAARKLEKLVEREVNELAMKARFRIQVNASEEEGNWTSTGFDQAAYLIATNPGEPEKPLEEIASGGELSRVMLALKACVEAGQSASRRQARGMAQRTLVFDEIDTGIGGRAAEAVGRKLKELAGNSQVLCVTHLPQIACFADQHYLIQKSIAGGRTRTTVRRIQGSERTDEVARMLSGAKLTEASKRNAEQMLRTHA